MTLQGMTTKERTSDFADDTLPGALDTRSRIVLDSVAEGVVMLDTKLRVTFFNREAERLFGDISGLVLEDFLLGFSAIGEERHVPAEDWAPRRALREKMRMKSSGMWERDERPPIPLEVIATPIRDKHGGIEGVVMTMRDTTEQLAREQELREFITIISHQFRTPLASVSWFLEILMAGKVGDLEKSQWELVQRAREALEQLNDILRLTMNASSIEFGGLRVHPKPHDIGRLITEEVERIEIFARRKKQVVTLKKPRTLPTIPVDETILQFILMNLLSNAIKYSPEGASIGVSVEQESRRILISVADQGMGIPKGEQSRIFTKFFRAKNALMDTPGTGLGLYIVKRLLEHIGGTIWFESPTFTEKTPDGEQRERGTTFTFAIPRKGFRRIEGHKKLEMLSRPVY